MGILEIVLLIAGAVIFILGFVLPEGKQEPSAKTKEMAQDEIKKLVSEEMAEVKSHVEDVVDESIEYAMEKTERSLERLSNEKIMAVNEYSDTVLSEIHKNHEEVMFLYDMLNDKHTNLKNTVSQVNQTVKEALVTTKEAEAVISSMKELQPDEFMTYEDVLRAERERQMASNEPKKAVFQRITRDSIEHDAETVTTEKANRTTAADMERLSDMEAESATNSSTTANEKGLNNNQKILMLHRQGKSPVSIAKELGLGVGEVKLVIDLYKNVL